ncbi:adenine deaminase C-terminal domain-containing protein [Gracilibacillus sp. S3-1-1]|uniref:Adenine deaminase C-terminal domain-containing protein n=1 Tax=Gracilibacillus pellucidus TaxID=3095368 RepID=A0ACC6M767_9BACI|nr:adenine deaminase C-terminal domain-containing protein [Gracilibacillus sp. S3-1-1]MDX8046804.1 adenine deaminase C-terminal domain-containing protein [Gracilibacillus sp. S3-1-1]
MNDHLYRWRNKEIRKQVAVIDGTESPTMVLKNACYLNVFLRKWLEAHIWIYHDRIVYVGSELPQSLAGVEVVECTGKYVVPGYIEPHAHPFQLYNPHELAMHAGQTGTTTLMNDNLPWLYLTTRKKAFSLLEDFMQLPVSMYWWARFDSQSVINEEQEIFKDEEVRAWLEHEAVVQGGELTAWPQVMRDDDRILYWMQEAKRLRKPVEGHFPGASEQTLVKLKLLGVSSDHEALSGEEVYNRLSMGYRVGLRHSSVRPDLPKLLKELQELGVDSYDFLTMTTDGSTPAFYENGLINECIQIAIDNGVPTIEAYMMATYNAAEQFHLEERLGGIAPGRVAHVNILSEKNNATPESVIAKGKWLKKEGKLVEQHSNVDWHKYGLGELDLDWQLTERDLQFSMPVGLKMVNDVIMKPYPITIDCNTEEIRSQSDESFLMLIDREGKWRVNTVVKGFTKTLGGLCSSYSLTGDIILIGKSKSDLLLAFTRMKELGGGIVLVHEGKVIFELPLQIAGMMYNGTMQTLIEQDKHLKELLIYHGYQYQDPPYNLLFLSSMHLPFVRVTPLGIIDVKKKEILFPAIMR